MNIEPILSLQAFLVSFILALMLIAVIAEIIVKKQNKSSHSAPTLHEQESNLQIYYSTCKKVN